MYILEPQRKTPVIDEVDLCVIGGSCTGVFAAIKASKLRLKVAVIEKQNCFGGVATASMVHIWHTLYDDRHEKQIVSGLTYEVLERLNRRDEVYDDGRMLGSDFDNHRGSYCFNTEALKIELDTMVGENNITPYLHTSFVDVVKGDNGYLDAIIVENKNGRGAIKAKVFIDASGDGDVLRRTGHKSYINSNLQPPTMCVKFYGMNTLNGIDFKKLVDAHSEEYGLPKDTGWGGTIVPMPELHFLSPNHVFDVNCGKSDELTYAEMEGRRYVRAYMDILRKYGPEGTDIHIASLPSTIGIRDTYHIECKHRVTEDEILNTKAFHDAIGYGTYHVDVHHSDYSGMTFKFLDGSMRVRMDNTSPPVYSKWGEVAHDYKPYYEIPMSIIQPKQSKNIFAAGRMMDAEIGAFGALRVMVNTNQMGEAAGVASYVMLNEDSDVNSVSSISVRRLMKETGSIIL